ncbi:MAG: hypothetical protein A3H41_03245 [Omnitrophica WOR_2 bacterium RIFCSPLOWO2_02_FULL_45_28]|nr:MAG: hypothetical protein A3H41_03245 [Omnitrophica WOR_2 bacterium RIFCSPLOWO2_02_FULL_45_28]
MFRKNKMHIMLALLTIGWLCIEPGQRLAYSKDRAQPAPDFVLTDIHGDTLRLSDFKGKVVLIDFWATWCPFCRSSIPILKSLYDEYKDKGLVIIGIALEYDQGQTLKRFAKEKQISYPLAVGTERLAAEYSAYGVPARFLINRQGEIVENFIGFREKGIFESAIKQLLQRCGNV